MAFTKPYPIRFSDGDEVYLEFLHEIVRTPMAGEDYLLSHGDGFHEPHVQEYCELIFFQSGSRDIRVGDTQYTFGAGDILVVTPEETHVGRSHACVLDRYYIHIYPHAFAHLKDGGRSMLGVFYDRDKYTNNKLTLPYEARARVQKLLSLTDNTLRFGHAQTREIEAYALVLEILGILSANANAVYKHKTETDTLFLNILSYIENSYPEENVTEDLLRSFGISRSTLWRLFKTELGTTPGAYLLKVRLKNAALLLDAGFDVTSAALACGFSDCSHFIKRFKEKYAVTPLVYRRKGKTEKS